MKRGLSDAVFTPAWELDAFLKSASAARFDGVELNVRENKGELTLNTSICQAKTIFHMAKNYGLEIASITTGLHNHYALSSKNKTIRERGIKIALHMIELAAHMKAKVVQIVPGVVTPDVPYDNSYSLAQESLTLIATVASAAGVTIGVENVCNKFLPSPFEFLRFLDEIRNPCVQAYFDTGNAMVTGHPEHFISLLGNRIVAIHAKNYRHSARDFVSLLDGDVNWPAIVRALREIPYHGYVMSTPPYPYLYCVDRLVETASKDLAAVLNII